jgi:hypothetical protein
MDGVWFPYGSIREPRRAFSGPGGSEKEGAMPATSKAQRKVAAPDLPLKRRQTKVGDLKGASQGTDGSVSEVLAATHRTQPPEKKSDD